jgi:hypothetical protein
VSLRFAVPKPVRMKLRLRVPGWAAAPMPIQVNGNRMVVGKPGTYAMLDRSWRDGDTITFSLPMDFRVTRYTGAERIAGHERYALEYGPILLAATGPFDPAHGLRLTGDPQSPRTWLTPKSGQPLHFVIAGDPEHDLRPYLQVGNERFTTYPIIEAKAEPPAKNL